MRTSVNRSTERGPNHHRQIYLSEIAEDTSRRLWSSPDAAPLFNDGQSVETYEARQARELAKGYNGNGGGTPLAMQARLWSTIRSSTDGEKGGPNQQFGAGGTPLPSQAVTTTSRLWSTASARDWKDTPGMSTTGTNPDGSTRTRLDQLPRQAQTMMTGGVASSLPGDWTSSQLCLNPLFVEWLMDLPAGWTGCEPSAMESYLCRQRTRLRSLLDRLANED